MREILFRGKPKDKENFYFFSQCWKENCKDGFVYGSLVVDKDRCFIVVTVLCSNRSVINNGTTSMIEVIPETVGQYTGVTDRNGKKIFEGDIVKTESDLWHGENKKERVTRIGEVIYDEKFCQFGLNIKEFSKCFTLKRWKGDFNEVIGNIHDNPELLKEGNSNA